MTSAALALFLLSACGNAASTAADSGSGGSAADGPGMGSPVEAGKEGASTVSDAALNDAVANDAGTAADGTATDGAAADGTVADGAASNDGGSTSPRKRGLAYGFKSDADLAALSAGIGWWYNWSPKPDSTLAPALPGTGVEFVPMIWGGTFDPNVLSTEVPAGAKYLLTFNEPNFGTQSNLTPGQAAALWPKVEAFAMSRGLKIVSPALNYCGGNCNVTNPFDWLDKFFAACTGCRVDYVAAHWYACSKSALTGYLSQYESKYKKPLWLTEFSCLDSTNITEAQEEQYMKDAVAALEADPMVFRYAWFTGRFSKQPAIDVLMPNAGALTPLGHTYVSLP